MNKIHSIQNPCSVVSTFFPNHSLLNSSLCQHTIVIPWTHYMLHFFPCNYSLCPNLQEFFCVCSQYTHTHTHTHTELQISKLALSLNQWGKLILVTYLYLLNYLITVGAVFSTYFYPLLPIKLCTFWGQRLWLSNNCGVQKHKNHFIWRSKGNVVSFFLFTKSTISYVLLPFHNIWWTSVIIVTDMKMVLFSLGNSFAIQCSFCLSEIFTFRKYDTQILLFF